MGHRRYAAHLSSVEDTDCPDPVEASVVRRGESEEVLLMSARRMALGADELPHVSDDAGGETAAWQPGRGQTQNEGSISAIRLSLKTSHFSRNSLPTTFSTSWAVMPWSNRLAFSFVALCLTHETLGQATASRVPSDMAKVQQSPRHSVQLRLLLSSAYV